ncbi:hypothetical protein [Streptomyces sp. NBC_01264]|uniref:hypothetical protein n=1 Tax=Streptomyces sp. NBC_01264 TaxID=2903804 RepID=UPI0022565235|nr:hypothetical protein [Streptomyces sp. NBC_01264]MCX4783349.1 hypothetical protein [Streptomyces sp. NBC_01264]
MAELEEIISYLAHGDVEAKALKFAVVVHPWWQGKTKQPVRGLDYGEILVADPDTREIRFARHHSRPLMGGWHDRVMGGGRRKNLQGGAARYLNWDSAREHIIQAAPADFDYENECVAWFDGFRAAEEFAAVMQEILKRFVATSD